MPVFKQGSSVVIFDNATAPIDLRPFYAPSTHPDSRARRSRTHHCKRRNAAHGPITPTGLMVFKTGTRM